VWLSPPLLAPKGPDGKPKKIAFGGWMLDLAFPMLAKMKGLRGGPLDLFGRTDERRMERALIAEYEADVARLIAELTDEPAPEREELAQKIAEVPQAIRGFGHIKEAAAKQAKVQRTLLWRRWEAAGRAAKAEALEPA